MEEKEEKKQYKTPVFSHETRVRCDICDGTNIKPYSTKYNGLIKYWKCEDCKNTKKTIGKKV